MPDYRDGSQKMVQRGPVCLHSSRAQDSILQFAAGRSPRFRILARGESVGNRPTPALRECRCPCRALPSFKRLPRLKTGCIAPHFCDGLMQVLGSAGRIPEVVVPVFVQWTEHQVRPFPANGNLVRFEPEFRREADRLRTPGPDDPRHAGSGGGRSGSFPRAFTNRHVRSLQCALASTFGCDVQDNRPPPTGVPGQPRRRAGFSRSACCMPVLRYATDFVGFRLTSGSSGALVGARDVLRVVAGPMIPTP